MGTIDLASRRESGVDGVGRSRPGKRRITDRGFAANDVDGHVQNVMAERAQLVFDCAVEHEGEHGDEDGYIQSMR